MKRLLLTLITTFACSSAFAASPEGLWLTKKGDVAVTIAPCLRDAYCGTIHWLRPDVTQVDPDGRPLCGQQVLFGFTGTETPGLWGNGTVLVADKGDTYSGQLQLTAPDRLELRAYLGTPMIGKTKLLRRVNAADYPACASAKTLSPAAAPSPPRQP